MKQSSFKDAQLEWALFILMTLVVVLFPILIFPIVLISFFFYLSKVEGKPRTFGISFFRTLYALIGIITYPLLHFGPQAYIALLLEQYQVLGQETYTWILIFYRTFFLMVFPVCMYFSAYLLTILDFGGVILPAILLGIAIITVLFASLLSRALFSPIIIVFAIILIGHIIFFKRQNIKSQFNRSDRSLGLESFIYFYALIGIISLYVASFIIDKMNFLSDPVTGRVEIGRLIFLVSFAILSILASSRLYRKNIWGYRIPIFLLGNAILLEIVTLYLPILLVHIVYFNITKVKKSLDWE